jgi:hypothetical protein
MLLRFIRHSQNRIWLCYIDFKRQAPDTCPAYFIRRIFRLSEIDVCNRYLTAILREAERNAPAEARCPSRDEGRFSRQVEQSGKIRHIQAWLFVNEIVDNRAATDYI